MKSWPRFVNKDCCLFIFLRNSGFHSLITESSYTYRFSQFCSPTCIKADYLKVHAVSACSLQAASIVCSSCMKVLRFGNFHDVVVLQEGEIQSVPQLSDTFIFKIHMGVTVYLLNSLL